MEQQNKTCTRCYGTKSISHFQTTDGKLRITCAQCRESISAKKRRSDSQLEFRLRGTGKIRIKTEN